MPGRFDLVDAKEAAAALKRAARARREADRVRDRAAERARERLREARAEMLVASRGGKTYEQIAEALGVDRSLVSAELRRAREEADEDSELAGLTA